MRLAWATDIHLNFCDAAVRAQFYDTLVATGAGAIVVTGDIAEADSLEPLLLELAAAVDRQVYFVLGNHDFYGGWVRDVRARARGLAARDPRLVWLPAARVVPLGADAALVGHDGWADGRFGDWRGSKVVLNDYLRIADLASAQLVMPEVLARIQALAGEAAAFLGATLPAALAGRRRVVVATHVPPFRESCWYDGRVSNDDWLPHFSSRVVGEAIVSAASGAAAEVTVLCGHTHGAGTAQILPNLVVMTGGADYGAPRVAGVLDV